MIMNCLCKGSLVIFAIFFPENNTVLFQRDGLILKMVESQKLPKRLVEAYGKVLEELGRGVPMKDDTYL